MSSMKTAISIAGSDSSGGAGIQADIKTFSAFGVYGMSAITAITAQNTTGIFGIQNVEREILEKQIDSVFSDIRPDGVKIGMTGTDCIIETVFERLSFFKARNIVFDPVMASSSGTSLFDKKLVALLKKTLLSIADLVTPNISEAQILSGIEIRSKIDMEKAAKAIFEESGCKVLVKGGHLENDSPDYFFDGTKGIWFEGKRICNPNTHGTGCTLSSAICANLALGNSAEKSIEIAKEFLNGALKAMLDLGKGSGPLNHFWNF